jgi:hypothetical protein
VALLYDASGFIDKVSEKRTKTKLIASASEAGFSEGLRSAGAYAVLMPGLARVAT